MLVFPAFMLPVCVIKSVILFNRGSKINKDVRFCITVHPESSKQCPELYAHNGKNIALASRLQ